jgi:hypothetical protein
MIPYDFAGWRAGFITHISRFCLNSHTEASGSIFAHFQIEQSGSKMAHPHTGSSGPIFAQSRIGSTGANFAQPHSGSFGTVLTRLQN